MRTSLRHGGAGCGIHETTVNAGPPRALLELLEGRTLLAVTAINVDAINPTEGVPFGTAASPKQIATFDVNNYIGVDESSEYSALIAWGDGTTSAGLGPVTVTFEADLGNGNAEYSVNSYHTYAEATTTANPYSLTVTIDDNTGPGTNQSQSGDIQVNNAPLSLGSVPSSIAATVGGGAHECKPWNLRRRELAGNVFGLRGPGQLG